MGRAAAPADHVESSRRRYALEILLVSFAALLLEISYTRVISFKLFYYYTYLVIGLALLGIGCGGVIVAISRRLRRADTETILVWGLLLGAVSVGVGYVIVATIRTDTISIWDYGSLSSFGNLAWLLVICLALFSSFVAVGVMIATLFARKSDEIGRLYFADLVGAGIACAVVVSLIGWIGPPGTIMLAGLVLALAGLRLAVRRRPPTFRLAAGVVVVLLAVVVVRPGLLPQQRTDAFKGDVDESATRYTAWSPIFRVDVLDVGPDLRLLYHDGLLGSVIQRWDGKTASLGRFGFESDPRSLPFAVIGREPRKVLIVGAAGGHEVLTSLYYNAAHIDAIELNPVTHSLVTDDFADYAGNLAENPAVNYVEGDGRSFLARSDDTYNLVWYPAPDSYSATNAATAGAYVLSESYLYTSETIKDSLEHAGRNGIVAAQYGEFDYDHKPNRTTRYVATARHALAELGVDDPARHILVATKSAEQGASGFALSTILVKATPFTNAEVDRFLGALAGIPGSKLRYAPGHAVAGESVSDVATLPGNRLDAWYDSYPYDVHPITDDSPFFWHFTPFRDVLTDFAEPIDRQDFEVAVGERVLLLLLGIAAAFAAVFLLLPFVRIRSIWSALPRKRTSAVYFTALGLGFMFFEITLIQRLVLFLGYPTYSLTVTLAAILLSTGVGALLSSRYQAQPGRAARTLLLAIGGLTLFFAFGLPPMADALLGLPFAVRVVVAFAVLAPLGICLGAFMPLGLGAVSGLTKHSREYVAWGWAVNGFASVIGAVLTTILAMALGFGVVLFLALVVYGIAVAALGLLQRSPPTAEPDAGAEVPVPGALTGAPQEAPVPGG
jgi:MFS family permease